jgi:ABC-type multidrug transport system ATPase subunit
MATLHPVESGSIVLDTLDYSRDRRAILNSLIFLPQNFCTYPDLSGQEVLEYHLQLRGANRRDARSVALAWLEAAGLGQVRNAKTGTYSQGMLQRLGLAYAMQVDVRLYLLDEPFAGVDPEARDILTNLLFSTCGDRTVLVSTHHVDEMVDRGAALARLSGGTLLT